MAFVFLCLFIPFLTIRLTPASGYWLLIRILVCAPCAAAFLFALMPVHVLLTESSLRIDNKIPDAHEHYVDLVEQRAQKAEQEVEK